MKTPSEIYISNLNAVCHGGEYYSPVPFRVWSRKMHRFDQSKFYFITEGRCRVTVGEREYIANAGDWFYIPAGTLHSYGNVNGERFEKFWLHFDVYSPDNLFELLGLPYIVTVKDTEKLASLFENCISSMQSGKIADTIMAKSHLTALIAEYINLAFPEGVTLKSTGTSLCDEILKYISDRLSEPLNVSVLAAQFGMHPNTFIRYFREKNGQTPARYIKLRRMERARYLLKSTDLSITEIMERVGENDLSGFSKQFKSVYSMSPRDYREYSRSIK